MGIRILSAVVGVALFLALCFGGLLSFTLGVTVLAVMGIGELLAVYRRPAGEETGGPSETPLSWLNPAAAWIGAIYPLLNYGGTLTNRLTARNTLGDILYAGLSAVLVVLFAALLPRAARTGKALGNLRAYYGLFGLAYVGMLFGTLVLLRALPGRLTVTPFGTADRAAWLTLLTAACVWATDTSAYLIGRGLGQHKLAPALSPNKTVEGALGGLLGGIAVGVAFAAWLHLALVDGLVLGLIAGVAGQIGDLFESALKREAGIKDFGRIMPGHGGVLDRFDSLLFVVPLAYCYLRFFA